MGLRRTLTSTGNTTRRQEDDSHQNPQESADRRAAFSATAHAADQTIVIAMEEGKQVASFSVGDSRCVLKDDQIRCALVNK